VPYSLRLAYPAGRTSRTRRGPEEAAGHSSDPSASGPAVSGTPVPPTQPDVVISLHPHGLACPWPLLPYKAALPPLDVGVSSHPLYGWGTEVQDVARLPADRRLGGK
jgi:hypothetical protein